MFLSMFCRGELATLQIGLPAWQLPLLQCNRHGDSASEIAAIWTWPKKIMNLKIGGWTH